jgi:hypothetical protein
MLQIEVGKKIKVEDFETLADNQICDKIFTDVAEKLAIGMVNLSNLISPKAFILGYKAYYLPDKYIKMIEEISSEQINNVCFECGTNNPEYISINNGVFICQECVQDHLQFPREISTIIINDVYRYLLPINYQD